MYMSVEYSRCILLCVVTIVCCAVSAGSSYDGRTSVGHLDATVVGRNQTTTSTTKRRRRKDPVTTTSPVTTKIPYEETRSTEFRFLNPKPPDVAIECKALRSKRYITDGFCTSLKPIEDMVCTGNCLPINDLPWYAEFIKIWSRTKTLQYRCVDDVVRYKRVTFSCDSGETRSYKIRVVRSCKCKRYLRNQNESPADSHPRRSEKQGNQRPQKLSNLSDQK